MSMYQFYDSPSTEVFDVRGSVEPGGSDEETDI